MSNALPSDRSSGKRQSRAARVATRPAAGAFTALALLWIAPGVALADEPPPFHRTPVAAVAPTTEVAGLFELKIRLSEGGGLARPLVEAGIDPDDAAAVARAAAGHVGGLGGGEAMLAVSRTVAGGSLRLQRVTLLTRTGQAVIDRRGGVLVFADQSAAVPKRPHIA